MCLLSSDWPKFWNLYKSFLLYKNIPTLILKFWKKNFLIPQPQKFWHSIPYWMLDKNFETVFLPLFQSFLCVINANSNLVYSFTVLDRFGCNKKKHNTCREVEGKQMIFAVGFCFGQRWKQRMSKLAGIEYNHYQIPFMGNWSSKKQRYDM